MSGVSSHWLGGVGEGLTSPWFSSLQEAVLERPRGAVLVSVALSSLCHWRLSPFSKYHKRSNIFEGIHLIAPTKLMAGRVKSSHGWILFVSCFSQEQTKWQRSRGSRCPSKRRREKTRGLEERPWTSAFTEVKLCCRCWMRAWARWSLASSEHHLTNRIIGSIFFRSEKLVCDLWV